MADKYASIRDKGRYRIQSVDMETFLERRNTDVVLRPRKKGNANQEWNFVKTRDNVYEIESVADSNWILIADISTGSTPFPLVLDQRPVPSNQKTGTSWTFYTASQSNNQLYMVSEELRANRVKNYLVFVDSDGHASFKSDTDVKATQDFHRLDKGEDYAWRLVEVTPASLPDGDSNGQFRIRTMNGLVIHTLPNQDTLSTKNQNRGDHRAWIIKDLGNGNCTIYNVEKKKYLATRLVSDIWEVVLADNPPLALMSTGSTAEQEKQSAPWRIEAMSDYTWSIYVMRGTNREGFQGRDKLSLSLKNDTAILKPWKTAHNQIWMIEPTDAPVSSESKPTNDSVVLSGSALTMNTAYKFMSNDRSGGIRVAFSAGSYVASLTNNTSFAPSPLLMERPASGQDGEVSIYRSLSGEKHYVALSANQVKVVVNPYSWTIEQAQAQGFYLIRDPQSKLYLSPSGSLNVKAQSGPNDTTTFWVIEA